MSISAGTFVYISTMEILLEEVHKMNWKKVLTMVVATCFMAGLVMLEKASEQEAKKYEGSSDHL